MSKPIAYRNPLTGRVFRYTPAIASNCGHLEPIFEEVKPKPAPKKKAAPKRAPLKAAKKEMSDGDS